MTSDSNNEAKQQLLTKLESSVPTHEISSARIRFMMLRPSFLSPASQQVLESLLEPFDTTDDLEGAFGTTLNRLHSLNEAAVLQPGELPKVGVRYGIDISKLHGSFVKDGVATREEFGGYSHAFDGVNQTSKQGHSPAVVSTPDKLRYGTLGLPDFRATVGIERLTDLDVTELTDTTIRLTPEGAADVMFDRSSGMVLELSVYQEGRGRITMRQRGEVVTTGGIVFPKLFTTVRYTPTGSVEKATVVWNREVECNVPIEKRELEIEGEQVRL
ncbi:MAG: hypothetical protein AB8G99_11825 [Planctomycetaceae bacterium]